MILYIAIIICIAIALLYAFDYQYIIRGIKNTYLKGHTSAYIDDYTNFDNRKIHKGKPQPWELHEDYNKIEPTKKLSKKHADLGTVAFLIIKNDQIWHEHYYEEYHKASYTNSFSMAKSIVSALLGAAIKDGYIKSLEQPVGDFIPKFSEGLAAKMTVGDLSSMSSGLNWDEHYYSPFSLTARAYLDRNLREVIMNLEVVEEPGKKFTYLSGSTQLLAMVLEQAIGTTLSDYLSKALWKPIGAEKDALWQLDSQESGMEKSYCCIASNARDFARIGRLYKQDGLWNGQQLLPKDFVKISTTPRFLDQPVYGYGWWIDNYKGKHIYYMRGILGQYTIVIPEDDIIIVRLGHKRIDPKEDQIHSADFYTYIDEAYTMLNQ